MKIILGSASERRKELMKRITPNFDVVVSSFNEDSVAFYGSLPNYVMDIAEGKMKAVKSSIKTESIIIGCDTIVNYENHVLGKPKDENDAFSMLRLLSGNFHQVYSGIAICNTTTNKIMRDYVRTDVKFAKLSDDMINAYIKSGEPMDKAAGYGIQGLAGVFVEEIHGCYYNVVGLPLNKLYNMLRVMGVEF